MKTKSHMLVVIVMVGTVHNTLAVIVMAETVHMLVQGLGLLHLLSSL